MERELWLSLYAVTRRLDKQWGSWKYSAGDILGVYFWAVVNDRPMVWALKKCHWPKELQPKCLPSQSTLSRRMRKHAIRQLLTEIEEAWLALTNASRFWVRMIDGKGLTVSGVSKDRDAHYGRGAGGLHKGYKLHAVWTGAPLPVACGLAPMNVSERAMARLLLPSLTGSGYVLGDAEYDANVMYELAGQAGHQLVAPKRQKQHSLGHRQQSPYRLRGLELTKTEFGQELMKQRRQIEREFGNLTSFGGGLTCLPSWARRFTRVLNWVHAKLLVNAARWFRNHPEVPALA